MTRRWYSDALPEDHWSKRYAGLRCECGYALDPYLHRNAIRELMKNRLVQLGPYHLDAYIDGVMLLFTHHDVPGLIGFIGTIFGKHQVNIAQMTVGRQLPGGEAIAVLNLDSDPPEEALKEVRAHPQISSLSVVKLPPAGDMPAWFG